MEIKQLSESFSVSSQLTLEDLPKIKNLGYKTLIGNRPDGEEISQVSWQEISEKAKELGMRTIFIPISTMVTCESVKELERTLEKEPSPFLAYCRSGHRSSVLWENLKN